MASDYIEKKDLHTRLRSALKQTGSGFALLKEKFKTIPWYFRVSLIIFLIMIVPITIYFMFPEGDRKMEVESISRQTPSQQQAENVWEPPGASPRPLASGKQIYNVSGGKQGAPRISQVVIDPIDPSPGQKQSLSVKVAGDKPATAVDIKIITDKKTETHSLKLTDGTNLDGTWTGRWEIDDFYLSAETTLTLR